jgi:NDP-sugar pyrophosphorylase family protein
MKAMILAAGLGTRLRPLTDDRPKALVEVAGRTLLEVTLSRLRSFGVREAIINVHHFAGMILEYLKRNDNFNMRIEVSREENLLDTGGGLKKAAHFFLENSSDAETPFFVHNVDVVSTIDLDRMLRFHTENRALVTLAVQDRGTSRYLLFDQQLRLCGRRSERDQEAELVQPSEHVQRLAFCGIHVISPSFLSLLQEEGAFSITDAYLDLAARGACIMGFRADEYYWRDLGSPANLKQAAQDLAQQAFW